MACVHDVVIAGAGPVGLFLACELGLAGCSVLVLEREAEPDSPWRVGPAGRRFLTATSVEAFDRRGLLPALLRASDAPDVPSVDFDAATAPRPRSAGHFAGIAVDPADIEVGALPVRLPGPATDALPSTVAAVESVLAERASELGVAIQRGVPVSAIEPDGARVTVRAGGRDYEAHWVVGCDGAHSAVRTLAGFEFVGTEPQFTGYVILGRLADPGQLAPGFTLTPMGMVVQMPGGGYLGVMDADGGTFDGSQPPTREHLQAVLRRVTGTDVRLTDVEYAATFTDRAMQATAYRNGRVLLAGDAAHIHAPLGGQGLNTGLGDAVNLGWKLAATVRGSAPAGLLDTFTRERHPVAAGVLDWARAQAAVMRPGPYTQALQGVLRDLLTTRDGTTYVAGRLSGAWTRYDMGGAHGGDGAGVGDDPGDPRALVGRDAPDFCLEDGTRLGQLMQQGSGVVLDFSVDRCLHALADPWADRIRYAAGPAKNDLGLGAVLVRPDGVVAWTGAREPDRAAFQRAAGTWFGEPGP